MTTDHPTSPVLSEEYLLHPNAIIRRLREEDPIHYVPGADMWLATRHEDVKELFTHPDSSNDRRVWGRYEPMSLLGSAARLRTITRVMRVPERSITPRS